MKNISHRQTLMSLAVTDTKRRELQDAIRRDKRSKKRDAARRELQKAQQRSRETNKVTVPDDLFPLLSVTIEPHERMVFVFHGYRLPAWLMQMAKRLRYSVEDCSNSDSPRRRIRVANEGLDPVTGAERKDIEVINRR